MNMRSLNCKPSFKISQFSHFSFQSDDNVLILVEANNF